MLSRFRDRLDLRRYRVQRLHDLLSTGRWLPESEIKEALEIMPDNRSMFAYNSLNREVSRLRQRFRQAGINTIVIARHDIDGPGYVMFEVQDEDAGPNRLDNVDRGDSIDGVLRQEHVR